jgi:hypothetical protein
LIRPKRKLTDTTPLMIQIDDLTGSWFDTLKQEVMNVKENLWLTVNSEKPFSFRAEDKFVNVFDTLRCL